MRWKLFANEAFLFLTVQILGLYVGYNLFASKIIIPLEVQGSIVTFLIAFTVSTTLLLVMLRYFKRSPFVLKALFAFLVFVGAETVFSTFIPEIFALALAIALIAARFYYPTVLTQNLAIIISIAGISATLGMLFPVAAVLVILAILSVYDFIAVYKTKHMLTLFKGLMESGVPFSIVVPDSAEGANAQLSTAQPGKGKFLMLGTGDLAFPIIFAVSALSFGLYYSISILAGAFVALFAIHVILARKKTGAIPALPPIAFFSALAFAIALLILH